MALNIGDQHEHGHNQEPDVHHFQGLALLEGRSLGMARIQDEGSEGRRVGNLRAGPRNARHRAPGGSHSDDSIGRSCARSGPRGCVKKKLDVPAPAQELYKSPLFRKERSYAEHAGVPWFVLSAEHGLVAPGEVLAPYDLRLSKTSRGYRRACGARVVERLGEVVGPMSGMTIKVHAGSAYTDSIRDLLIREGATVVEPLAGLLMGDRLAWYGRPTAEAPGAEARSVMPDSNVTELLTMLTKPGCTDANCR